MHPNDNVKTKDAIKINLRGYKVWWKANPKLFISSAMYAIVEALTPYAGIYLSALILDELSGTRNHEKLTQLAFIALSSAAFLAILNAGLLRWKNCQHAGIYHMENHIYNRKLLSMDFASVDNAQTHDLLSQIKQNRTYGLGGVAKLLNCFERLLKSIMVIAGAIALTVPLFIQQIPQNFKNLALLDNPLINIAIIVIMLTVTFIAPIFSNKADSYYAKVADTLKLLNRHYSFYFSNPYERTRALDFRIYRQDVLFRNRVLHNLTDENGLIPTFEKYTTGPISKYKSLAGALSQVFVGMVYIFICLKAWTGAFGVGAVTQYIGAITAISSAMSSLVSVLGELNNNAFFLRTTFEFLDTPNDMYQGSLTVEKRSDKKHQITFRNVSFKYPNTNTFALRNVSMQFNIGERLAVVGMNGSGKTTFIKLLCRLYDPTEGEILLNGINIKKYNYHEYMSIFSVVFQDFQLLAFKLGQNVAANNLYDNNRVRQCLSDSGFDERLERLPDGLETCLYKEFDENGIIVSGGEAQKIALARALYKEASFIILDEPTASLDPVAEFEVYNKMNEIVGNKTAVFISHRLSSCRFCNDIAVFHESELIQRGSHHTLLSDRSGKYFELWTAQAQYYVEKV